MNAHLIPVTALCIFLCVLAAGCTLPGSAPAPVPAQTPSATALPVATTIVPVVTTPSDPDAGPLQPLSAPQQVNLDLTKDRPTSQIHLLYQGGAGDVQLQGITMHVYRADGSFTEYLMDDGRKPGSGDEIVATGTRDGDRCVVYVNMAGTRYKVIDENVYPGM